MTVRYPARVYTHCVALLCLQAYTKVRNAVMHGMEVDIHKAVEEDPIVAAMWVPS